MFRFTWILLNLTLALNVLLFFLLLVEERVQLPLFLQVTGRMHPLVLHFPLALIFVGIFLECLAIRKEFRQPAVAKITTYFFHLFAFSAALTALFGFFLFTEGSYQGESVLLHKWIGASVSLLAFLLAWLKERTAGAFYYATLGICVVCLVLTGHAGAEVTHGSGFLTEPVRKKYASRPALIENADSAVVFRDVIQPILNEKCLNCHNLNRAKGDLILADHESVMRGGKSRDVVIAGKAEESLLYKYALLPMDDTLHMPPKDKLQLDREEIRLIGWWINTGAKSDIKYVNLEKVDSIQTIMAARFHPRSGLDLLDIPFVDREEIESLNNPYRTVQQISATRPYIAVFLGSKKDFTDKDLSELKAIRNQVVSIDLGNSRVTDEDLIALLQFPHVQKLHLQNSGVGDQGVKHLKDLRFLETLNLSGTKITAATLDEVSGWEDLRKLYLYNTSVSNEAVALENSRPQLEVYKTRIDLSDTIYDAELTPPVTRIDSQFFRTSAYIDVKPSRGKVKYYYTLDGTEPTSESILYEGPFRVYRSGELKILATMDGWKDSKVTSFPLMRLGSSSDRVQLISRPDPKYPDELDSLLTDGKSGGLNRGDGEYLAFTNRDVEVLFHRQHPGEISALTLSFLEDIMNGVFAPEYVEIWGGMEKDKLEKLGRVDCVLPSEERPAAKRIISVDFPARKVVFVRLTAKNVRQLPTWHPLRHTNKAAIYLDEVSLE